MATELSSGAISSILEAVPGIATVLRSPVADAIVNLSRAAAGLAPFDPKYAHELIRYAVRRGLIRSDEGDRVAAEIDGVPLPTPPPAPAPAKPAAAHHAPHAHHAHHAPAHQARAHAAKAVRTHKAKPTAKSKGKSKARPKAKARRVAKPKKRK